MTGFEHKSLHIENQGDVAATIQIQIDFHGHGRFGTYQTLTVDAGATASHTFPTGFSAHWVRLVSDVDTTASAQFFYT